MRQRIAFGALAATSLTLLAIVQCHLYELAEALRTYATFYPYLAEYPETLYRNPNWTHTGPLPEDAWELTPAIIHQIFLTDGRDASLSLYEAEIVSCQTLHPNWTHHVWNDESASNFIAQEYPLIWPHYRGYKQSVQRANILRYALLDHFGGVYLDLDVTCLQPLDDLRHLAWLTPGAYPAGLNNAFMLSRPHHALLKQLLAAVPSSDLAWGLPYIQTMLSTGCMFLSNRWMSYARSLSKTKGSIPYKDKLYVLADKHGKLGPHMLRGAVTTPLFRHGGASSWHEWDAAAVVLVGKHSRYSVTMMGVGAIFIVAMVWRLFRRSGGKMQRSTQRRRRKKAIDKGSKEDGEWV